MGKEKRNVSTAEENKAIFRRYAEEVGNQLNFEIVDEIFERYISHQPATARPSCVVPRT